MKVASITGLSYQPRTIRSVHPVKNNSQEKLQNQKRQNVNFGGCKWTISEAATWTFLGTIIGGPAGAAAGALIGALIGRKLDKDDA